MANRNVDVDMTAFNLDLDNYLQDLLPKAMGRGIKASAEEIQKKAKANCPVDTGALRESIDTDIQSDLDAYVGSDLFYAIYVHQGTSRGIRPRKFLQKAADETDVKQIVEEELQG